jgi:hypothetical protein
MVGVMTIHATKSTRLDGFNIILSWVFVVIAPLGVLVPLVLISPRWLVLGGLIPALTKVVIFPIPSLFPVIVRWMSWVGYV